MPPSESLHLKAVFCSLGERAAHCLLILVHPSEGKGILLGMSGDCGGLIQEGLAHSLDTLCLTVMASNSEIDLSIVFYMVGCNVLIHLLADIDVQGTVLPCFSSFPHGCRRESSAWLEDFTEYPLKCAVPQEAFLLPILFNIYMCTVAQLAMYTVPQLAWRFGLGCQQYCWTAA